MERIFASQVPPESSFPAHEILFRWRGSTLEVAYGHAVDPRDLGNVIAEALSEARAGDIDAAPLK